MSSKNIFIEDKDTILIRLYLVLTCLLCVVFVSSNLIFKKFVYINITPWLQFEVSVGVLYFPITFLITDLLTEFYGKDKAKQAVQLCLFTGVAIIFLIVLADYLNATDWSPIDDHLFTKVFNVYEISVFASFITFYISQIFDIHVFSMVKKITHGKHLWLRNNLSSFISQFIDTVLVIGILCLFGIIPISKFPVVVSSSYMFKLIIAVFDTPFCYLAHFYIKKYLCYGLDEKNNLNLIHEKI
ncbi:MAG: queuosine precursor transporter [Legionellales bacterium]|nr:queuosine precursor transporter [Legionellales bacterium]